MPEIQPAESSLLLSCARRAFDAEAQASVEALLYHELDWTSLLAQARRHNMLPLLYERLQGLGAARFPPEVLARLKGAYYANLLRNERLGADLVEVVTALRGEGVDVIVLKGGALARTVYDNPAQRPMIDLDLLVRQGQMARAGTVLEALGYGLSGTDPVHMVAFQQRFGYGSEWVRAREGRVTRLDVQSVLVGAHWCRGAFPVVSDALWEAARPLDLEGTPALQLSPEDTLIHLCLHLALHHGYQGLLIGCADMDRVVSSSDPAVSWPRLVERAGRFRVRTAVYYGLQCARQLLGTPVPDEVHHALKPGRVRLRVLRALAPLTPETALDVAGARPAGVQHILLYAALVDRVWDVGSIVQRLLFPSREWLIACYSLDSRGQVWFYRLVHPLRIVREFLRGVTRPLVESTLD